MSNIMISDLYLTSDSEDYLQDLDASEQNIQGGYLPQLVAFGIGFAIGYYAGS